MTRRSFVWIAAAAMTAPSWSQATSYIPVVHTTYTPPEVSGPHAAQKLTLFRPGVCPPEDTGLYPVVLYSPASMFAATTESGADLEAGLGEFHPLTSIRRFPTPQVFPGPLGGVHHSPSSSPGQSSGLGFLGEALASGWAVVTVGTTGWNSWQTCEQLLDCAPDCNTGTNPSCGDPSGCWDTNLWYAPDSEQWNDFDRYWGEKEFLWARQWVGKNAATYGLDNNRVVVCGTSTGAIYASFLAFGPNRAWDDSHSVQAQQDTRVAAIVAFEPNTWLKALGSYRPGVHWPASDSTTALCGPIASCFGTGACYNRRAQTLGDSNPVAAGLLEKSSISRWVRCVEGDELPTPAFIAAGDGNFTTGFARDATQPEYEDDYDRHMVSLTCGPAGVGTGPSSLIPGDPMLEFSDGIELRLHDSWYAVNFAIDLAMLDDTNGDTFHQENSRLFLQEGHDWSYLPSCIDPMEEPVGLDGTYPVQGLDSSIDNVCLAPQIVAWMEEVLHIQRGTGVSSREPSLPSNNPVIYSSPPLEFGKTTEASIDLNGAPGYEMGAVLIFTSPSELVLSGGQVLLCDVGSFYASTTFFAPDDPMEPGIAHVPLGPFSPVCASLCTQAILLDVVPHSMPFALTNALDFTVQR